MAPLRSHRKRKRLNKRNEENACNSLSMEEQSVDQWDKIYKKINGLCLPSKGLDEFKSAFNLSKKTFNYICSLVKDDMVTKPRDFTFLNGKLLFFYDEVAVALRRLGSGDSLVAVADSFGLNHSTVSLLTWRFVELMEARALHHICWPSSEAEMSQIKSKFEKIQGLPNCCGVVDTTHITMLLPSTDPTNPMWLDREKNHSMILQTIVDPEMRFRDVLVGFPGRMDDADVFRSSKFFQLCESGERLNGKAHHLEEGGIREYIMGGSHYPLLPFLIVPYTHTEPSESISAFNERHFATQIVARRALVRLKEMWKFIHGVVWRPDKHKLPRMILVCCLLHNIVIDLEDEMQCDLPFSPEHDFGYMQQTCHEVDVEGALLRDRLSVYLCKTMPS